MSTVLSPIKKRSYTRRFLELVNDPNDRLEWLRSLMERFIRGASLRSSFENIVRVMLVVSSWVNLSELFIRFDVGERFGEIANSGSCIESLLV